MVQSRCAVQLFLLTSCHDAEIAEVVDLVSGEVNF